MLPIDINERNSKILEYLIENKKIPSYNDIDKVFGYSNGAMSKAVRNNTLKQIHATAIECEYGIPRNLFFNSEINNEDDINEFLFNYDKKSKIGIFTQNILSIEALSAYKYFYLLDNDDSVVKRKIEIYKSTVTIYVQSSETINFQGNILSTCSSIVAVTENPKTGNVVLFKVQRNSLIGEIIPISYMGHRSTSNEEVAGYGICVLDNIAVSDEEIKNILSFEDNVSFPQKKRKVIEKIKEFRKKYNKKND